MKGIGKRQEDVFLFRPNPADCSDGLVLEAHPVLIKDHETGREFATLAKPNNPDDRRVLVRLIGVEWQHFIGEVTELAFGWESTEEDFSYDTLLLMKPGAVIRVRCKNCDRPADALILTRGELTAMPFRQFVRLTARMELEDIPRVVGAS